MKTAATATLKYGVNGTSVQASNDWANNFSSNIDNILNSAIKAIPQWQAAVATAQAAINMSNGLTKAKAKEAAIVTKVQSVGKASFTAGIKAAALPTGGYAQFSTAWMPVVSQERSQLDISHPRGDRAANRARQAAYDAWIDTKAGQFRVK